MTESRCWKQDCGIRSGFVTFYRHRFTLPGTGVITLERVEVMHSGNPIPANESEKVTRSLQAVKTLLAGDCFDGLLHGDR